jgi:pullulanase/glycogen debranching enzyme
MGCWPGSAYSLGATFDGSGTNFALFSDIAERVELCLFDDDGKETNMRRGGRRRTRLALLRRRCSPVSATATGCTVPMTGQGSAR